MKAVELVRDRVRSVGACALISVVALGGCATPPTDDPEAMAAYERTNDPYEPLNRAIFDVNDELDKTVLRPVTYFYREVVPKPLRVTVHSFLSNLTEPVIFINDVLQGEFDRAGNTLARFTLNSGLGMLGIADIATGLGYPRHTEDFGQTLAVYGVGSGPYLMLPLFGPSNPRDLVGLITDMLMDPFFWTVSADAFEYGRPSASAVDTRDRRFEQIDELRRTSLDFYATVRSLYRQRRADEIRNGRPGTPVPAPAVSQAALEGFAAAEEY